MTSADRASGVADAGRSRATDVGGEVEVEVEGRTVRWVFRVAALLTVLPIAVAAVRHGLDGWIPVGDAATTAVRANDVFSRHLPLIGMYSSATQWVGRPINFPGALQLYVMAVPMRLFGNTWGVLLGVATINATAILTSCWLIRRRLGARAATVACVFLAAFVWMLGSEVLVDMTPMQMITVPTMLLFVAAWSVADGDLPALPILVFTANYLFLDHLALAALVPIMVLSALVLLYLDSRRRRREEPTSWPQRRQALRRWSGLSLLITVIAWLPPLFQQFFRDPPHNLTNLYEASKATPPNTVSWESTFSAVGATIAAPPWWLRPTFHEASFSADGTGRPALLVIACSVALLLAYGAALLGARRRQDRALMNGLLIALASVVSVLVSTKKSTNPIGLLVGYLHSVWVSAVFVWMMLAIAAVRLLPRPRPPQLRRIAQPVALAVTAVWCVLALPASDQGAGSWPWAIAPAKAVNAQTIPELRGKGPILVMSGHSLEEGAIQSSLLLAMQDAGIPFVLEGLTNRQQFGARRAYAPENPHAQDVQLALYVTNSATPPADPRLRLVASATAELRIPAHEFAELDEIVRSWAARRGRPRVNAAVDEASPQLAAETQARLDKAYDEAQASGGSVVDDSAFVTAALGTPALRHSGSWLDTTGINPDTLRRWAEERYHLSRRTFRVYLGPISP